MIMKLGGSPLGPEDKHIVFRNTGEILTNIQSPYFRYSNIFGLAHVGLGNVGNFGNRVSLNSKTPLYKGLGYGIIERHFMDDVVTSIRSEMDQIERALEELDIQAKSLGSQP